MHSTKQKEADKKEEGPAKAAGPRATLQTNQHPTSPPKRQAPTDRPSRQEEQRGQRTRKAQARYESQADANEKREISKQRRDTSTRTPRAHHSKKKRLTCGAETATQAENCAKPTYTNRESKAPNKRQNQQREAHRTTITQKAR